MGGIAPWFALIALCLALYLPGLATLPPFDRDEGRFVQATKQMMETGDYVQIRYLDTARNKKPVGIHWAQVAATAPFGGAAAPLWAYRLPSVLGALAGVLLIFALGRQLFDPRTAFIAAALMGSALVTVGEAHLAKTDAALFGCAVAAQMCLALAYQRGRAGMATGWGVALGFWIAMGLAALLKGPVIPVVALLTVLALGLADRRGGRAWGWLRGLKPWVGLPLAVAIVAPWLVLIQQATGGQFLAQAAGDDLIPKLLGGKIFHSGPPGYYLALVALIFFPGSLLLLPGLVQGWRTRLEPAARVCLAWVGPSWILFELTPNKLPHYVLPLLPPLALLGAHALITQIDAADGLLRRWWARAGVIVPMLVPVALGAAGLAAPWYFDARIEPLGIITLALGLASAGFALIALLRRDDPLLGMMTAIGGTGLIAATLLGGIAPRLEGFWVSRAAAETVEVATGGRAGKPIAVAGYAEPSLVFLLGSHTRQTVGGGAADDLLRGQSDLVLVEGREEAGFRDELAKRGGRTTLLFGTVSGLNYSRGHWVTLRLYGLKPAE